MAGTTTTTPTTTAVPSTSAAATPSIHWILYPVLILVTLFAVWLWHDTEVHDAAAIQAVATAKATQADVDKTAQTQTQTALADAQKQNADLTKQLATAKTTAQQLALINQELGTKIQQAPPTPSTPSPNPSQQLPDAPKPAAILSQQDVTQLAQESTKCAQVENQVGADQIALNAKDQEITARDTTIKTQGQEITALKGGSHLKRFLKAAKYVVIGVAAGVVIDRVAQAK